MTNRIYPSDLTDSQWERIKDLFPAISREDATAVLCSVALHPSREASPETHFLLNTDIESAHRLCRNAPARLVFLVIEALRTAKAQTYLLKQIIVIDDGSDDDTARRVAGIEGVEYYYQQNRGQGAARNYGLRFADGEYVASLDSDDLWDEDFLTRSVECLEAFQLDFVFTNWEKLRGEQLSPSEWLRDGRWKLYRTNCVGEWSLLDPAQVRKLFLERCPAPSASLLIRRNSIVSGWGERMKIADDWYLLLEMALHRPCRAAFSLTSRWKKRVDGRNVYDGQPFADTVRKLYLHDYCFFGRDFRSQLTRRERLGLARRERTYRLRLMLHETISTGFAARVKIHVVIGWLRGFMGAVIK